MRALRYASDVIDTLFATAADMLILRHAAYCFTAFADADAAVYFRRHDIVVSMMPR